MTQTQMQNNVLALIRIPAVRSYGDLSSHQGIEERGDMGVRSEYFRLGEVERGGCEVAQTRVQNSVLALIRTPTAKSSEDPSSHQDIEERRHTECDGMRKHACVEEFANMQVLEVLIMRRWRGD